MRRRWSCIEKISLARESWIAASVNYVFARRDARYILPVSARVGALYTRASRVMRVRPTTTLRGEVTLRGQDEGPSEPDQSVGIPRLRAT